ncbi:MAG: chemotaxis protein CheW [Clostridiales bacterium]|nr:chemotaxis protein CheW [Clostridiales bacterium]
MEILIFKLAKENFAIPVEYAVSIEHMLPVTYVPKSRQYVEGLANIRGNVVPVIDITKLFMLDRIVSWNNLLLINYNNQSIALVVDEVDDVINMNDESIKTMSSSNGNFSVFEYQNIIVTYLGKEELNKI